MQAIFDEWFRYCQRYYTFRTFQTYRIVLNKLSRFLAQNGQELTTNAVERYIDFVLQDRTTATANRHLISIKSFCRWQSEHYNMENVVGKIKLLREKTPTARVLNDTEYAKVITTTKGIDLHIIQFLANTGLRKTEFKTLTDKNIGVGFIHLEGKGRKTRLIPLNQTCKSILASYPSIEILTKKYLGSEGLYWCCKKAAKQAGIEKFGPHALRHFFATRLMRAGVPIAKIARLLGHSSIRITEQIYIHWIPSDVAGITDVLVE